MRKLTLVLTTVLGLVSLVAIAVVLAAALVRSEAGTRWVIDQAQAAMGESLAIGAVQGNLGDRLTLKGIRYTQAGMELDVASVDLSWHPAALLGGRLQVAELLVSGVQVQLFENEEAAPESAPFDPESLRPPVDISLARLSISDLAIVLPDGTRHPISSIEAALTVEGDDVQLTSLTVDAPQGALAASLKAELNASLPLEGSLDWNAALPDGREAGGLLTLAGSAERLVIDHQGRGAVPLSLRGSASDLLGEPGWDIELSWPDSVLYSTPDQSVRGSGALASSGTLAAYTLAGNGVAAIPDVAPLSWAIDADGNSGELALEQLTLATSPYALQLDGRIGWASELTAELNYRASAADLQAIAAELPPQVDASGVVSVNYQTDQVQLDAFTLALAQSPATLQAKARLGLADTDNPELALDLEWQNLGWPLDTVADMQSPAGSLSINGVLQDWQALVSADVAGGELPPGSWAGELRGGETEARIERLVGNTLDGEISLLGQVAWAPEPRWSIDVTGDALNPGVLQPDLPGELSFDLATTGSIPEAGDLQASVSLSRAVGMVAGLPVDAVADVTLAGERIVVQRFAAASGNNSVSGAGTIDGETLSLQWQLSASQLAALVPDASGVLTASGDVTGTLSQPRVALTASGRSLVVADLDIVTFDAAVQAGLGLDDPLQLKLDMLGPAGESDALLGRFQLEVAGTTREHVIDLVFNGGGIAADTQLMGGLDAAMVWAGSLRSLGIDPGDPVGRWESSGQTALTLSAESAELGRLCLKAAAGGEGRACAAASWQAEHGAEVSGEVASLQLVGVLPDVTGQVDGDFELALAPEGNTSGRINVDVSDGVLRFDTGQGVQRLEHGGGSLTASLGPDGLDSQLIARPLAQGDIRAQLQLPELQQLPPDDAQPLTGQLSVDLPDLSGFQAWVPELDRVQGRVAGELGLSGTVAQPRISGELGLVDGTAEVPVAGLSLRDIALGVSGNAREPELLMIDGGLLSGSGRLTVAGQVNMDTGATAVEIAGDKVQVFNTADAVASLSPDLAANFTEGRLKLRGTVTVDRADITPRLSLRSGAADDDSAVVAQSGDYIPPSPDVVVVGADVPPVMEVPLLPFELDSELVFDLGQRVNVNALGFVGRITGLVIFTNPPESDELVPIARGAFEVQEGTFRSFGQDLEIQTGQLLFRAVPATEPEVNLRAVRWIDNDPLVTLAGVRVTGPLDAPELELYSTPQLEMTEIQSYLLTGRSPSSRDSALSIGTFIRPKLYVGYGYNLLEETSEFDALYTISPRYGAQASVGEADNNIGITFTYEH